MAESRNKTVLIVDNDEQESTYAWGHVRRGRIRFEYDLEWSGSA